jgi:hypothetical protein
MAQMQQIGLSDCQKCQKRNDEIFIKICGGENLIYLTKIHLFFCQNFQPKVRPKFSP